MNILALNTSFNNFIINLEKKNINLEFEEIGKHNQCEKLVIEVEGILEKANLSYKDLNYIIVTIGPGSFTGIRIGLAFTQGLAIACGVKVITVSNLEMIAFKLRSQALTTVKSKDFFLTSVIEALRGEVYIQTFNSDLEEVSPPLLLSINEVDSFLNQSRLNYVSFNPYAKSSENIILSKEEINFTGKDLILYAREKIKLKNYSSKLEPLYIREADAVIKNHNLF